MVCMETVKRRRDMYAASTRQALIDAGLEFFAERGYGATSAEEVVQAAGLSRGALYHHFGGKPGLFEAIFDEQERAAVQRIVSEIEALADPWQQASRGVHTYLDVCCERNYREIVLRQGPIALGWRRWRELDRQHFVGLLTTHAATLVGNGIIVDRPPELVAASIYGSLAELALTIADSDNTPRAHEHAGDIVSRLLQGLLVRPDTTAVCVAMKKYTH